MTIRRIVAYFAQDRAYLGIVLFMLATVAAIVAACLMSGCAVGRGDNGDIVLGFAAGRMVETVGQAGHVLAESGGTLANLFFPGSGTLVSSVLGALGVGGAGIFAAKKAGDAKAAAAKHEGEDKGFEYSKALFAPPPPISAAPPS